MGRCAMLVLPVILCVLAEADVVMQDASLERLIPAAAYEGIGVWEAGGKVIATGHSSEIDALGAGKGVRAEKDWAELDCKRRMMESAAAAQDVSFDPSEYEVTGETKGFSVAATYTIADRGGLFLIGVVPKDGLLVKAVFSPSKARQKAMDVFDAGEYADAAARFARLSQRGVQDEETMSLAKAASWHVNLDKGVQGTARRDALEGLGAFY